MWSTLSSPYGIILSGVASLLALRWYMKTDTNTQPLMKRRPIPPDDNIHHAIHQSSENSFSKNPILIIEGNLTTESIIKVLTHNAANLDPQITAFIDTIRDTLNKDTNLERFSRVFIHDHQQGCVLIKSNNEISPRTISVQI